jgi:tripartite-type tricarboxylate transporter receptor subunit TctC
LIAYAKANPGKLAYGSSGNGSPHHLAGALFNQMAGTDITHVPYKGGAQAVTDAIGGQLPLVYSSLVSVIQQIKAGKLKAIAVTERTRYAGLPEVPALAETLPGFEMTSWLALFGPAGLPPLIVERLNTATVQALQSPDVKGKLEAAGLLPVGNTAAQFAAQQKLDFEARGRLVKSANIQGD